MRFKLLLCVLTTLFFAYPTVSCFSQFRDYRKAVIIKSNGESIVGKVDYKMNFHKHDKIRAKTSQGMQWIAVSELESIELSNGEIYKVIGPIDSTGKKMLARTLIDGGISLYRIGKFYFLKKDTAVFQIDSKTIAVKRAGKEVMAPSKKYLLELHRAFADCQTLDYEALAKSLRSKPLVELVSQYGECKNIEIRNVRAGKSLEVAFTAGVAGLDLSSSFFERSTYTSGMAASYTLSFLKELGSSNRVKIRLDLIYLKSEVESATTVTHWDLSNPVNQYVTFSGKFNGVRIPLGVQYYFFNNTSGLYISGGVVIGVNKYKQWDAVGHNVFEVDGSKIYVPSFKESYKVEQSPVPGLWFAIGGDVKLAERLKLNFELKALKTSFNVYGRQYANNVTIDEYSPSVGLKYILR